jgi:hypothetical protein
MMILLAGSPVAGQDWARKMFRVTEHDFGTVARGAKAEFDFNFSNLYLEDVHIQSVRASCSCTSVQVVQPLLKTYEEGAIRATFNTASFLGDHGATLTVTLDKPYPAEVQLHVKGFIRSDVMFTPGSVQFGDVDQGQAAERSVAVSYAGRSDWKILGVKSGNPGISATMRETGRSGGQAWYQLDVRLDPKLSAGYLSDQLVLTTNDAQSPQLPLLVEGQIRAGITVSPASLFMGIVKPGQEVTKPLVIRGSQPFRVLSIACDDKSFRFGQEGDSSAKTVHVIPVTFLAGSDAGKVTKTIRIETDLGKSAPELSAYAVVAVPAAGTDN